MYDTAVGMNGKAFKSPKKATDLYPLPTDKLSTLTAEQKKEQARWSADKVDEYMKQRKIGKYANTTGETRVDT